MPATVAYVLAGSPTLLAFGGQDWVSLMIGLALFVPFPIAAVLVVRVVRGMKTDPDEQRLRRAQADYERARRDG